MTTPVSGIGIQGFIKNNDQNIVTLKLGYQRTNVGLQPVIGYAQGAIVRVIAVVGNDKPVVWQSIARDVDRQLGKWHQVLLLRGTGLHV